LIKIIILFESHCPDFCEKYNLRWRIAGFFLAKSADSSSVEYGYTLPRFRLDSAATLPHTASTGLHQDYALASRLLTNRVFRLTNPSCHGITLFVAEFAAYNFIYQFHKIQDITI